MEVRTSVEGATATIEVVGKLTVQTSPDLSAAVDQLPKDVCDLAIDLTDVEYIASAGLRVLVGASKLMVSRGGSMILLHPCDDVVNVFEMTGLITVFDIER